MKKTAILAAGLLVVLGASVFAYGVNTSNARSDCPGTLECPITGEEVCKDRCPLFDANRLDCPGKTECPLTGDLVCRDECPLGATEGDELTLPPCCQGK